MRRLSIARSVQLALLGLTIVLTAIAGSGVAALYSSRQQYEDELASALRVQAAAERLLAATVIEETTLRTARGPSKAAVEARAAAKRTVTASLSNARRLSRGDVGSLALLDDVEQTSRRLRAARGADRARQGALTRDRLAALKSRQDQRLQEARRTTRSSSRTSAVVIVAGGGLALGGAFALVAGLLAAVRRPLDDLVEASARVAGGDLAARVDEDTGPDELRLLGRAFNAMAVDLERARESIEDERRRLDVTVRSLGDGLVLLDGAGNVSSANPRAEALVPGLAVGQSPATAGLPLPPMEEAAAGEVLVEHRGRVLAVTAAALDEAGRDSAVVWTLRDATERTRVERLKSEFVATASHELRSPLTSIKGFVELLAAGEGLEPRQREFLDIVSVSTNRLVDLVNDLLDVTRLEAGGVDVHRRPVDLAEAIEEVVALLRPRIDGKDQHLVVAVSPGTPRALADPARLRQILMNLVTNAHLYTGAGGRIEIVAGPARDGVRLVVRDTGSGMSPTELEHVFERFTRGAEAANVPGSGLGLPIVKSLVDLHHGTVDVRSTPGEGTSFIVTLPAARSPVLTAGVRQALRGRRILILDAEEEARTLAAHLELFGVDSVLAEEGTRAMELLRGGGFDALVLEVLLAGMSGFEVLREIRADAALADLPVLVVSTFSGRESLPGEWVVRKPVDPEELRDALGAALLAGRVRVLAACRPPLRGPLAAGLDDVAIAYEWVTSAAEAARACARRRFEVALVDPALPGAAALMEAIDLRGRRMPHAVLLLDDGSGSGSGNGAGAGDALPVLETVAVADAGARVLEILEASSGQSPRPL